MYQTIRDAAGGLDFKLWNAKSVGAVFDELGIEYPRRRRSSTRRRLLRNGWRTMKIRWRARCANFVASIS